MVDRLFLVTRPFLSGSDGQMGTKKGDGRNERKEGGNGTAAGASRSRQQPEEKNLGGMRSYVGWGGEEGGKPQN